MKKDFSPAGKSGIVKIFVFLVFTAAAGQLRILYLEGKLPFLTGHSEEQRTYTSEKRYEVKTSCAADDVKVKPVYAPVENLRREGFFSRLGIGKAPPVTYIVPPDEEVPEIEIQRVK